MYSYLYIYFNMIFLVFIFVFDDYKWNWNFVFVLDLGLYNWDFKKILFKYNFLFAILQLLLFISPLRSIPADGFIAWRNFCLSFRLSNLANKSGVATLSVTKNCSMGAIYLTWQGCFRRFLISGAELSKYDFFLQNIAILNTFSSSVNW